LRLLSKGLLEEAAARKFNARHMPAHMTLGILNLSWAASVRTLRRRAVGTSHLHGLGTAIVAGLDEELDRLAISEAAEPVGDDARLRRRTHPVLR